MAETPDDLLNPEQEVEAIRRISTFYANGNRLLEDAYQNIDVEDLDRQKVIEEVNRITNSLETGTKIWIEDSFPELYIAAAIVARKLVKKAAKEESATAAKSVVLDFVTSEIDQETINAVSSTTFGYYQEALSGVRRKTSRLLDRVVEEKIKFELSKQTANPITLAELKQTVLDIIEDNGVSSLTDSSGRVWQLDTYAEMVARTQHTQIVNSAMKNQALQDGFDLVRITVHGAMDSCGYFEGKIYSLTGATKGYPELDTARAGTHLFAPNCKHSYVPISQRRAAELGPDFAGSAQPYVDLRKFVSVKAGTNPGGVVRQQRDLISIYPTLSKAQQKAILDLARANKSPALAALEDLTKE